MNGISKSVGIGLIFIFIMMFIIDKDKYFTVYKEENYDDIASFKKTKVSLSDKENTILEFIFQDKIKLFLSGGKSTLKDGLIITSSIEVSSSYDENEVAANREYLNKIVYITGQIASINSGFRDEPFIELDNLKGFFRPQIRFFEPNLDKISELKKGDILKFVCQGNGEVISTPMFINCVFAEDYAKNKVSERRKSIQSFLNNEQTDYSKAIGDLLTAIFFAKKLPNNSSCYSEQSNCLSELAQLANQVKDGDLEDIEKELRDKLKQN